MIRIVNTKNALKKECQSNVVNYPISCRDLETIKTAHRPIHVVILFPFIWKKATDCCKLGLEEFIIMKKRFFQIFFKIKQLSHVLCCILKQSLYKLYFGKNKDTDRSSIMCKILSKTILTEFHQHNNTHNAEYYAHHFIRFTHKKILYI